MKWFGRKEKETTPIVPQEPEKLTELNAEKLLGMVNWYMDRSMDAPYLQSIYYQARVNNLLHLVERAEKRENKGE